VGNLAMMVLAAASDSGSVSGDFVPLYYGLSILALILSGLWALKRYTDHQRQQLIQQGTKEQQLSDKLEANTKAADKNTASIEKLGEKFDTFSSAIDKRLTLADYRLDRLEESNHSNGVVRGHVPEKGGGNV
jgi:hypothetical protein